jgi:hypothetical protein|tara:strand:- start:128 stop:400 length:273 start_codon:yes stop_codon:yes gene_type:complete
MGKMKQIAYETMLEDIEYENSLCTKEDMDGPTIESMLDDNGIPKITQELFYLINTDEQGLKKTTIDIGLTCRDFLEKLIKLQNIYRKESV